jgi:hypothetical protein
LPIRRGTAKEASSLSGLPSVMFMVLDLSIAASGSDFDPFSGGILHRLKGGNNALNNRIIDRSSYFILKGKHRKTMKPLRINSLRETGPEEEAPPSDCRKTAEGV